MIWSRKLFLFDESSVKEVEPSIVASDLALDSFTVAMLHFQEKQCLEQDYLYLKQTWNKEIKLRLFFI